MTQTPIERASLRRCPHVEHGRAWVIGHRGAMDYCPENTRVAFDRAVDLGADWVELDVHLTRDGALAVIHDDSVDRTTNGHGLVNEFSLAELQRLDAGVKFGPQFAGQTIPSLDEVLDWARMRKTHLDIEIKNGPTYYDGIEEAVVTSVDRARMTEEVIIISFDHHAVRRIKALDSRLTTGVLFSARPTDGGVALARAAGANAVLPHWAFVTPRDVDAAHAADLAVAPWASSDPAVLTKLLKAGVDAIATNAPDVLRTLVDDEVRTQSAGAVAAPAPAR